MEGKQGRVARRLWQLGRKNFTRLPSLWSTHRAFAGFSPVRGTRDSKHHTQKAWGPRLPPAQLPPRCFWNSFLNTECPWVPGLEREGLSTQPHPIHHHIWSTHLQNTTWICHLLTNPLDSFNPCPYLSSELSPYPSTSSLTSSSSAATVTESFQCLNQTKHRQLSIFFKCSILTTEGSQTLGTSHLDKPGPTLRES